MSDIQSSNDDKECSSPKLETAMRCYQGSGRDTQEDCCCFCFANSVSEAKRFMWGTGILSECCDGNYLEARVVRRKDLDRLLDNTKTQPYTAFVHSGLDDEGWA